MVAIQFSKVLPTSMRETNKMIRYTLFLGLVIGTAATALAHVQPSNSVQLHADSVAYLTSERQIALNVPAKRLVLQKCGLEDCSDTPQN